MRAHLVQFAKQHGFDPFIASHWYSAPLKSLSQHKVHLFVLFYTFLLLMFDGRKYGH